MEDPDKKAEQAAKQAISPAGLADRSDKGNSRPASEAPLQDAPPSELEDEYTEGENEDPAENVPQRHPNRNADGKQDSAGPPYS